MSLFFNLMAVGLNAVYSLSNLNGSYVDTDFGANTYGVTIRFGTDGTVDVLRTVAADQLDEEQHTDPGVLSGGTSIRVTNTAGSDMTAGEARGTWLAITANRSFTMSYVAAGGPDTISGTFTLELSNDGGSTIVATDTGLVITAGSL
jgi:hypothetical protein